MRTTLLVAYLAFASALSAQIVINEDDMPAVNDTLRYRTTLATGVDVDFTGAGVTWNMSTLVPQLEGADTMVSVGSTPLLYQLYFNNPFLYPQNRANFAVKGTDFSLMAFSLSDVYDYFRADANGFFNVGFGANLNGLPTSVRRQPIDRIYAFPLEFGDSDVSTSAFNVSVPTFLYFGQDQVRTTVVDGWGTLILPADTFEVLRVKSTLQRTDTIFVNQLGTGFRIPEPETIEYKWLAAGMGKPVLEVIAIGGVPVNAEFYYEPEDVITSVATASHTDLRVYPNPALGEVFVPIASAGRLGGRCELPGGEPGLAQHVERLPVPPGVAGGLRNSSRLGGVLDGSCPVVFRPGPLRDQQVLDGVAADQLCGIGGRRHAPFQGGHPEPSGEELDHLWRGAAPPALEVGDVAAGVLVAAEVRLREPLTPPGFAQQRAELHRVGCAHTTS